MVGTGSPLSVELGPGLLCNTFDGIQRPLETIRQLTGPFIKQNRGVTALSREKKWTFTPQAKVGAKLTGGDILGVVQETDLVEHRVMVPIGLLWKLTIIAAKCDYTVIETIGTLEADGK